MDQGYFTGSIKFSNLCNVGWRTHVSAAPDGAGRVTRARSSTGTTTRS